MSTLGSTKEKGGKIRAFFFRKRSKDVMVFLFFLLMSAVFWVAQALEEPMTINVTVPLKLENVPKDVIIATELPKEIQMTVRDKGSELIRLFWKQRLDTLHLDFRHYDKHGVTGRCQLAPEQIRQLLKDKLPNHSTITQLQPDTLTFYYNRGIHRRLPVKLHGTLSANERYHLDGYSFSPDTVDVYAPSSILDTLKAAYTEAIFRQDLSKNCVMPVSLQHSPSMRFFPDTVSMTVNVDILSRHSIDVYIQGTDLPDNKKLHTYPSTVTLTYLISETEARKLDVSQFKVYVSYLDIKEGEGTKCKPRIASLPKNVASAFITPQEVDYSLENISSEEESEE